MQRIALIASFVWASGALSGCSRYVLKLDDALQERPVVVQVDENLLSVATKLRRYLIARDRLESADLAPSRDASINFVQPWIRDSSLRYYALFFDERERHMTDWKAQWHLKPLGPRRTEISLAVLELIYVGPPENAGPRPEARLGRRNSDGKRYPAAAFENSDWYETDPDNLRAALEMRRFWIESYPLKPLPRVLTAINVPILEGPPTSKLAEQKRHWTPLPRPLLF